LNDETARPANQQAPKSNKRWIIIISIVIILGIGTLVYWLINRGWESTDDAQITGNLVPINPRVSGYIDTIYVNDNQSVDKGQMLVQLDTRDLQARLRSAEANLAAANAQTAVTGTQVTLTERTATSGAEQATSAVGAAEANVNAAASQIASAEAAWSSAQATADAANDAITAAQSDITTADAQIQSANAALKAAQANVTSVASQAERAANDARRFEMLFRRGATSQQQLEIAHNANTTAQAALKSAQENVASAQAAVTQARARKISAQAALRQAISRAASAQASANQAATAVRTARSGLNQARAQLAQAQAAEQGATTVPQQVAVSKAQNRAASARAKQAIADVRNAKLALSYTQIAAPVDGMVSQKSVQPGQYVQPGQPLMSLVDLRDVWIVANFKETQMDNMKVGQPASITVDTYPGQKFQGYVQSIGAATGSQFSVLPPENATGNFVKVVQRIPVKIILNRLPKGVVLRPGMNVVVNVNTRS
jgi:membrane fusion protein (multidrug efflux system)